MLKKNVFFASSAGRKGGGEEGGGGRRGGCKGGVGGGGSVTAVGLHFEPFYVEAITHHLLHIGCICDFFFLQKSEMYKSDFPKCDQCAKWKKK